MAEIFKKDVQDDQFISNIFMRARSKAQIFGSPVTLPGGLARSNSKFIGSFPIISGWWINLIQDS